MMLYWRDDVVRVRPFRKDPTAAWRLRRASDTDCPHWAPVVARNNQSGFEWSMGVVSVLLGWCDAACVSAIRGATTRGVAAAAPRPSSSSLPGLIASRLSRLSRLDEPARLSLCSMACSYLARKGSPQRRLPGCLCETRPPRADCRCGGGVGKGPHVNVDATPLMHRCVRRHCCVPFIPSSP